MQFYEYAFQMLIFCLEQSLITLRRWKFPSNSTTQKNNSGCCERAVLDLETMIECVLLG